ncbi:MAG: cupin domain-containing protein [Rhodospirillales bacterium]|nr:cupin domain-containing protein [Rhodospirillales bacterium]
MDTEPPRPQPRIVAPGDATALRPFGIDMRMMLGAEATGGSFSLVIATLDPGQGPPPHRHADRDEYFFVLEGDYAIAVDGREQRIGPGTLVYVPRGTVHGFQNCGATPGRMLEWTIPGENSRYFAAVDAMERAGGFDPVRFAAINAEFATEFVG